jgi:hypothetical protein
MALDREGVVPSTPTLDAVIERRNRCIKGWKFQRWAEMGKEVLRGSRSEENGETSKTHMEYGLSPLRRIESRRNREMDEKQVHTMASAKKIASGSDRHFPCGQQMQKYGYRRTAACTLCQKAHEERGSIWEGRAAKEDDWPHPECGMP